MVRVFSFCVYGTRKKYCQGLIENIKLIRQHYPEFEVRVAVGDDVPSNYLQEYSRFPQVTLFPFAKHDGTLASERFFLGDAPEVEVFFVRDADSRINARDRWCIETFLRSEARFHIIRDHPYHGRRIMAGMWGMKRGAVGVPLKELYDQWARKRGRDLDVYQSDQDFLEECVYPRIRSWALIHTDYRRYPDETISHIAYPSDGTNFVGNVIDYREKDGTEYYVFRL